MPSRYVRQPLLVGGRKLDLAAAPPAPARGCSYYWLHRMPKDESEYALLVDTLEAHGFRRAATPEQVAAAALLWCGTSTIRAPLLPTYEALQLHARIRAADNETIIFCWRAWWYGTAVRAAAASSTPAAARCGRAGRWCCGAAPSSTARRGATAASRRRQRDHHLLRAAGAGGAGGRRRAQRGERRIKRKRRLTLVLICCSLGRVRAEVVAAQPPYGVLRTLDLLPVHLHFVYLWALPMRILQMFLQICLVAQCDMAVAGSAGLNAAGIMPKVHDK